MPLPNNICRCHNTGCDEKEDCSRWVERTAKGDKVSHSANCFPITTPLDDPCPMKIKLTTRDR